MIDPPDQGDTPPDTDDPGPAPAEQPIPSGHSGVGEAAVDPADRTGDEDPSDGESPEDDKDKGDKDKDDKDKGRPKLSREQARILAEEEKALREAQALRDAAELARADAERLLAGPGLVTPDQPVPVGELEATWSHVARSAAGTLRHDLDTHRVGVAISGGGSLGSFEAGVLRFLYDHIGLDPVAICGNSAGALNAAKLAEGDHADRRPIDEIERIWRSLRINSDMWEPEPWLVPLQASASWAAALREQVNDSDSATSAVRVAVRVVGSLVRRPPETDGTIDAVKEAVRAKSLLSLSPVAELVRNQLDPERVRSSGIALRMGTVSLEAGELRYVTETGQIHDRDDRPIDQPAVPLASGVLASASIPMAFPPVEMNGEHYVDGGAREILPLEILVSHMGVERVIAISASSAAIKRSASFADRNLLDILRRVSAEIGPNETLRKELNPPGGWHPDVRLVVPQFNVHDSMTIDPALIAISLDHGYLRAADVLLGLGEEAAALTERITRIRVQLRHLAGPVPSIFDTTLGRARRERLEADQVTDTTGVETTDGGDDDDLEPTQLDSRSGESVVRSARTRTATRVAKLVKVIGRETADRGDADADPDRDARTDRGGDGARDEDVTADRAAAEGPDDELTVELEVSESGDADVELRDGDDGLELVITPSHRLGPDEAAHESTQPGTDERAEADRRADEERRAEEALVLTAELRQLTGRRLELGLPLPPTLLAWLREDPRDDRLDWLNPVDPPSTEKTDPVSPATGEPTPTDPEHER